METVKKTGGKVPVNGSRTINAFLVNGNLVGPSAQAKWAKAPVWDASFYNFQTRKWEPEGKRLTYRQAYARANYLGRQNPRCKLGVVFVTGATRALKKKDVAPAADEISV